MRMGPCSGLAFEHRAATWSWRELDHGMGWEAVVCQLRLPKWQAAAFFRLLEENALSLPSTIRSCA